MLSRTSYPTSIAESTPRALASHAADVVRLAIKERDRRSEQLFLISQAKETVSALCKALARRSTKANRERATQATEMLSRAAKGLMVPFSLTYAMLALDAIAAEKT